MKTNYPCLLTESKNKSKDEILNKFSLVNNEEELQEQKRFYIDPVVIQNVDIVKTAKRIIKQYQPV